LAAVIVPFAELVGVLETIRAATQWARQIAPLEDAFIDSQARQYLRPPAMSSLLDRFDTRFVLMILHGMLLLQ
jgi:hypothetical protein